MGDLFIRCWYNGGEVLLIPLHKVDAIGRTDRVDRDDVVYVGKDSYEVYSANGSGYWVDAIVDVRELMKCE